VIALAGDSFTPKCTVANHIVGRPDLQGTDPAELATSKLDAIWVRARIQALFHIACLPEAERAEKTLMSFQFVAVPFPPGTGVAHGIPFECTDYYGRSNLFFGHGIPEEEASPIGATFWDLLLRAPDEVVDYEDRAYHVGAGVWMHYGYRNGESFYDDSESG
jgi:hypothetical protein